MHEREREKIETERMGEMKKMIKTKKERGETRNNRREGGTEGRKNGGEETERLALAHLGRP